MLLWPSSDLKKARTAISTGKSSRNSISWMLRLLQSRSCVDSIITAPVDLWIWWNTMQMGCWRTLTTSQIVSRSVHCVVFLHRTHWSNAHTIMGLQYALVVTIAIARPHIEHARLLAASLGWGEVSVSVSAHMVAELSTHALIRWLKANVQIIQYHLTCR